MSTALIVLAAVMLDAWLGEPRRGHPLVGFGRLAARLETWLNPADRFDQPAQRLTGALALVWLVAPLALLAAQAAAIPVAGEAVSVLLLYVAIGHKSLSDHARPVAEALAQSDLAEARRQVALIVSREIAHMEPEDVARAATESVLENGNDAVFGALFWFVMAGASGVVTYRLVNTLDAMWGYRTPRFYYFGWAAARLDDALNYLPARLTALSYALVGRASPALRCWREQGRAWESPNAGPVMAAGAGALGVRLGGPASYHGAVKHRLILGEGDAPEVQHIGRALALVRRSLGLWLAFIVCGGLWLD